MAPRGPNPNPNVHHKETNVYPNPNLTSSYILTLTLTSIIRLYPNPNVQHKETSDWQNKFCTLAGDRQNIHFEVNNDVLKAVVAFVRLQVELCLNYNLKYIKTL